MDPKKTTLAELIDAFVASDRLTPLTSSALSRLMYWRRTLGAHPVATLTADEADAAVGALIARGRVLPMSRGRTAPIGKPLSPTTIDRYCNDLDGLYRYARRLRIIPRTHVSPLAGRERAPQPVDPERYFREADVEKLIAVARVVDQRWGRLALLIRLAYVTGLRRGNLMSLRWSAVDLDAKTVSIAKTKNGAALVAPINESVAAELRRLPRPSADALIFEGRRGRPHGLRKLWERVCREAGLAGKTFHMLRHGCASKIAKSGANQAQLMHALGHKSLRSSARYMHFSIDDRRQVMERVFGA